MQAAILREVGQPPETGECAEPPGEVVDVRIAGCNPIDLRIGSGEVGEPTIPSVVGLEGIGTTTEGRRVYFKGCPGPYGSWAERAPVDLGSTYPVPDDVDDEIAVALGIAGLAAWLPLTRHASIDADTSVLVLGATGAVGSIAVQAARLLGARRVVGAGRNPEALEAVAALGADATVRLDPEDNTGALREVAGDGFQVVVDMVYGEPFLAALEATAVGATLITVGLSAGPTAEIRFRSLQGRTHVGHHNDLMPREVVRAAYDELMVHAAMGAFDIPTRSYPLAEAAEAWRAQAASPHAKIAVVP